MSRPKGSRNALIRINYDMIGELVGIRGDTARAYAQRGEYDARSLESVLQWINGRRQRQGETLIGLPTDDASDDDEAPEAVSSMLARMETGSPLSYYPTGSPLSYDPRTGEFRVNDT